MKYISIVLFTFLVISCSPKISFTESSASGNEYTKLSMEFLSAIRNNQPTDSFKVALSNCNINDLANGFENDAQRYSFWLNIYNAYIQDILKESPELYEDRGQFFRNPKINIGNQLLSFGDIEHGIIRRSQNEFGLGYIRKWFPPKWERKLRVRKRDYRVHFALNCGAKDCPPVAIYSPIRINEQLNIGTYQYLNSSSTFQKDKNTVSITSLFSWFRGDFGGKSGTRKILRKHNIISQGSKPKLAYKNYDWTLYLDHFVDL